MKICCVQMNTAPGTPGENFSQAARLIEKATEESPDVLVLPETSTTGFFPREDLESQCDTDGRQIKARIGELAKKFHVNIVAGSVANIRGDKVYNTAFVFDRDGNCIAEYDKTHLFSPMEEDRYFTPGNRLCRFTLDGASCGIILCYDLRFPELTRALALQGMDVLFVPAQWPQVRHDQLHTLLAARAMENQCFSVYCNAADPMGGGSAVYDPTGKALALADGSEQLLLADCDLESLASIRAAIPVFRDRTPLVY